MTALAIAVISLVAPLRRTAAVLSSRTVLFALSPFAPDIGNFEDLSQGSKVVAADGGVLAELDGAQRREPVQLDRLPDHVTRAVLAAEDANFYDHGGVDPSAVFRAILRNAQGSRQGGSTITQQLAKLNYTNSEPTLLRKLNEVQYAVRIEERFSKDELLERYLNQVYFGDGAYGLAAAAQAFFATEPGRLTPAQAATLAGKIKAPEALDPRRDPDGIVAMTDVHGRRVTGGSLPAAIFAGTMREAVGGLPRQEVFTASPDDLGLERADQPPPTAVGDPDLTTTTTLAPAPTTAPAVAPAPTLPSPTVVTTTTPATSPPGKATTTTAPATTTTTEATTTTTTSAKGPP